MEAHFTSVKEICTDKSTFDLLFKSLRIPFPIKETYETVRKNLLAFLDTIKDDVCVVIETDYADPVYRDSYYNHYSIKLRPYAKDCVRLSFFESEYSNVDDFISRDTMEIQKTYLGFLVLRPLNKCIGRNAIDMRAKKLPLGEVEICKTKVKATCLGHKLTVKAFPHSSQDSEYMSCAENSIWTMMEYFGNKYTVYDPILPSQIVQALADYKYERLIPTTGLSYSHISMLLKKRGFETKVYDWKNKKFKELFACYIESGLPLIVCIQGTNFGHAVVCVGRKKYDYTQFNNFEEVILNGQTRHLSYWNKNIDTFVVNDDNFPSYHMMDFADSVKEYPFAGDATIKSFIAPMHEEIFVPAELAIGLSNIYVFNYLKLDYCCLRTYLTTCRSYKEYVINNKDFSSKNKQQLIQLDLPKFVWITEFVETNRQTTDKISGMLAIDATGNTRDVTVKKSLIFMIHSGKGVFYDNQKGKFINTISNFPTLFERFKGNLK